MALREHRMTDSRVWTCWVAGALFFFLAAMFRPEQTAVYIPVGVVFLILAISPSFKREH